MSKKKQYELEHRIIALEEDQKIMQIKEQLESKAEKLGVVLDVNIVSFINTTSKSMEHKHQGDASAYKDGLRITRCQFQLSVDELAEKLLGEFVTGIKASLFDLNRMQIEKANAQEEFLKAIGIKTTAPTTRKVKYTKNGKTYTQNRPTKYKPRTK